MSDLFQVIENEAQFNAITETRKYPIPEQYGPLRWRDNTMRCANKGCSSPTHCTVSGIPRCSIHALRQLNTMLYEFGVEK